MSYLVWSLGAKREDHQSRRDDRDQGRLVWARPRLGGGRAQEFLGTRNILLCQFFLIIELKPNT